MSLLGINLPRQERFVSPRSGSKIPICSTTVVKSATVFSLMVDGSGSRLPDLRQVAAG
jgi:hypothetical protein